MRCRFLGTCILLLGLLVVTSSNAYADAISLTTVTVSNIQIVPTSGTIVFSPPPTGSATTASGAAVNSYGEEGANSTQSPTRSEASTSITFASAGGVSDFTNPFSVANSNVMLSGCVCSAETEGLASLRASFMIVGGTGNVDVNISALLQTAQNLITDEFSSFAASDARFSLQVQAATIFSFDSRLRIGASELTSLETQRLLSQLLTLQFNQQYNLSVFVGANSRAAQNEIPEPATVVLLVSGLGFMVRFVRKPRLS